MDLWCGRLLLFGSTVFRHTRGLALPRRLQSPLGRLHAPFLHEMDEDIEPLPIPAQNPTPHIEALANGDLPSEARMRCSQHDTHPPLLAFFVHLLIHSDHSRRAESCDEGRACGVHIAKVGAIRLMQVVVALEDGVVARCYRGKEDVRDV